MHNSMPVPVSVNIAGSAKRATRGVRSARIEEEKVHITLDVASLLDRKGIIDVNYLNQRYTRKLASETLEISN